DNSSSEEELCCADTSGALLSVMQSFSHMEGAGVGMKVRMRELIAQEAKKEKKKKDSKKKGKKRSSKKKDKKTKDKKESKKSRPPSIERDKRRGFMKRSNSSHSLSAKSKVRSRSASTIARGRERSSGSPVPPSTSSAPRRSLTPVKSRYLASKQSYSSSTPPPGFYSKRSFHLFHSDTHSPLPAEVFVGSMTQPEAPPLHPLDMYSGYYSSTHHTSQRRQSPHSGYESLARKKQYVPPMYLRRLAATGQCKEQLL
ncbi:hypothetical protein ADUPG1_011035, partial [Aduncisulcus paluster]